MSKIIFNEHQRRQIEMNPNVASVLARAIQYTAEFKLKAIQENQSGKGPAQIFREAGFDLEIIGLKKAQSALMRWKKTHQNLGEQGFLEERRGKGSTGRPRAEKLSADKKLEKAEACIRLLESFLTPREKYQAINETIRLYQLKNMTRYLCEVANVSSSGYYKWLQNLEKVALREESDYQDYLLLKAIYEKEKGKIGYRGFYMVLVDVLDQPMNHKKILRLMRKFNLYTKIPVRIPIVS